MIEISSMKEKRVAIIGGAGFIGHNLAIKLKSLGAEPHVVDGLQVNHIGFYTSGYSDNPNAELYIAFLNQRLTLLRQARVPIHVVDVRDYDVVSRVLSSIKPDVVIHLAAIAHANRSNKDPFSTFDHSLRTLENVLDVCRAEQTHVIYLSSSMVYGNFDGEMVAEDRECHPLGIYGALKFGAEKLVIGYNQVFGLPYTIIRPSALYGPRCVSRRVGQAFIENALFDKPLSINGDGSDALDFTYVDDLIQGIVLAMTKPAARGEVFNVTYGAARTLLQMVELVKKSFPDAEVSCKPRDDLMPERGTLDISKAKQLLGYTPSFPLELGFPAYIDWYKTFVRDHPDVRPPS